MEPAHQPHDSVTVMKRKRKLELLVGSTIIHGGQTMVIREMRFVTPHEPMFVTTTDVVGAVVLVLEEEKEEEEDNPDNPFPGSVKVATMTPDEFDHFTKKHNITWQEMKPE
jgi:hypothetical protein